MKKFTSYTKGFTLIELLVVIAIIGILASVVLVSLSTARQKGKDAAIQEQLSSLRSAVELAANGGSYAGLVGSWTSSNANVLAILTGIGTQTTVHTSGDSATAWAAEAQSTVTTTNYFCVDSTGQVKTETTASASGFTACP